jgi:hypothetical protein
MPGCTSTSEGVRSAVATCPRFFTAARQSRPSSHVGNEVVGTPNYTSNTVFWTSGETAPGQPILLAGAFTDAKKRCIHRNFRRLLVPTEGVTAHPFEVLRDFFNYDGLRWAARRLTAGSVVQRSAILRNGQSIVRGTGQP